jgi:hypothetical protein
MVSSVMVAEAGMNLSYSLDVLVTSLASQLVSSVLVAGAARMNLTVFICLWHPWLDRR